MVDQTLSSASEFSTVVTNLVDLRRKNEAFARQKLDQIDAEMVLDPRAEKLIEIASLHHQSVSKLFGVTSPPSSEEETEGWAQCLRLTRHFLNALVQNLPTDAPTQLLKTLDVN